MGRIRQRCGLVVAVTHDLVLLGSSCCSPGPVNQLTPTAYPPQPPPQSEPRDYVCNSLGARMSAASATTLTIGVLLTLVSVVYSAFRAGSNTQTFRWALLLCVGVQVWASGPKRGAAQGQGSLRCRRPCRLPISCITQALYPSALLPTQAHGN